MKFTTRNNRKFRLKKIVAIISIAMAIQFPTNSYAANVYLFSGNSNESPYQYSIGNNYWLINNNQIFFNNYNLDIYDSTLSTGSVNFLLTDVLRKVQPVPPQNPYAGTNLNPIWRVGDIKTPTGNRNYFNSIGIAIGNGRWLEGSNINGFTDAINYAEGNLTESIDFELVNSTVSNLNQAKTPLGIYNNWYIYRNFTPNPNNAAEPYDRLKFSNVLAKSQFNLYSNSALNGTFNDTTFDTTGVTSYKDFFVINSLKNLTDVVTINGNQYYNYNRSNDIDLNFNNLSVVGPARDFTMNGAFDSIKINIANDSSTPVNSSTNNQLINSFNFSNVLKFENGIKNSTQVDLTLDNVDFKNINLSGYTYGDLKISRSINSGSNSIFGGKEAATITTNNNNTIINNDNLYGIVLGGYNPHLTGAEQASLHSFIYLDGVGFKASSVDLWESNNTATQDAFIALGSSNGRLVSTVYDEVDLGTIIASNVYQGFIRDYDATIGNSRESQYTLLNTDPENLVGLKNSQTSTITISLDSSQNNNPKANLHQVYMVDSIGGFHGNRRLTTDLNVVDPNNSISPSITLNHHTYDFREMEFNGVQLDINQATKFIPNRNLTNYYAANHPDQHLGTKIYLYNTILNLKDDLEVLAFTSNNEMNNGGQPTNLGGEIKLIDSSSVNLYNPQKATGNNLKIANWNAGAGSQLRLGVFLDDSNPTGGDLLTAKDIFGTTELVIENRANSYKELSTDIKVVDYVGSGTTSDSNFTWAGLVQQIAVNSVPQDVNYSLFRKADNDFYITTSNQGGSTPKGNNPIPSKTVIDSPGTENIVTSQRSAHSGIKMRLSNLDRDNQNLWGNMIYKHSNFNGIKTDMNAIQFGYDRKLNDNLLVGGFFDYVNWKFKNTMTDGNGNGFGYGLYFKQDWDNNTFLQGTLRNSNNKLNYDKFNNNYKARGRSVNLTAGYNHALSETQTLTPFIDWTKYQTSGITISESNNISWQSKKRNVSETEAGFTFTEKSKDWKPAITISAVNTEGLQSYKGKQNFWDTKVKASVIKDSKTWDFKGSLEQRFGEIKESEAKIEITYKF